jgi:hypothetical protein
VIATPAVFPLGTQALASNRPLIPSQSPLSSCEIPRIGVGIEYGELGMDCELGLPDSEIRR